MDALKYPLLQMQQTMTHLAFRISKIELRRKVLAINIWSLDMNITLRKAKTRTTLHEDMRVSKGV